VDQDPVADVDAVLGLGEQPDVDVAANVGDLRLGDVQFFVNPFDDLSRDRKTHDMTLLVEKMPGGRPARQTDRTSSLQ
jgi:hypothetical protein